MFTIGLNGGLPLQACIEKIVHGVKIHWLFNIEKVPGAVVSKEGHAESILGHEKTHHYWFSWKRCNYNQWFIFPTPHVKFTLFIEWPYYLCVYEWVNIFVFTVIIIKQSIFNFSFHNYLFIWEPAQSAGAAKYTDCISAEGLDPTNKCPGYDTKPTDGKAPAFEL